MLSLQNKDVLKLSIMERVYKGNLFTLYINGLRTAIAKHSIIDDTMKVLHSLGYSFVDIRTELCLDDELPNNEVEYWTEEEIKGDVVIYEESWEHFCERGCCFDVGKYVNVNGVRLMTNESLTDVVKVLGLMGYDVEYNVVPHRMPHKPGEPAGSCLEPIGQYGELLKMNDERIGSLKELQSSMDEIKELLNSIKTMIEQ